MQKLPCASTINSVLKRDFKLRYRLTNAASIKYNDTDYDEKRRWISRLLVSLTTDVPLLELDECYSATATLAFFILGAMI